MKRHPTLIELSRDHHHTLAMVVRILRDPQANHSADIRQHGSDLLTHFTNEEQQFAPLWAKLPDSSLRQRFEHDHAALLELLNHPQYGNSQWQQSLAESLREHVRFEERELFEAFAVYALETV